MLKKIALATVAAAAIMFGSQASAATKLGVLTCDVDGGWSFIIGSNKNISCVFKDSNGRVRSYQGHVTKTGIDVGYTGSKTIAWAVFSVNNHAKGSLKGVYSGVNAEVSALIGGGANILVGAGENNFMLQPVSGQIQTGVNVAVTVQSLTLY